MAKKPVTQRTDPFGPTETSAAPEVASGESETPETSTTHPQVAFCGAFDAKNPIPVRVWFATRTVLPLQNDETV